MADFGRGMHVLYVPRHANGDTKHKDCQQGIVSSKNDTYVFVWFTDKTRPQACDPKLLVRISHE